MYVVLSGGNFVLDIDSVSYVKWINTKNLALIRMKDGSDEWINSFSDFESLRDGLLSNHLKAEKVTTRQPRARKTHSRNYHKPADIPQNHVYVGVGIGDDAKCNTCGFPFQHPCHNASNPI